MLLQLSATNMAPAAIRDVFNVNRLPDGLHFIFFLLYFPLGTFLCILRLLFCVQVGIILSFLPKDLLLRRIILRIHGAVLGIIVFVDSSESSPSFKILVSNSISQLDSFVLDSIDNLVLVAKSGKLPSFLHWLMGYPDFGRSASHQMSSNLKSYCSDAKSKSSVLIFPEEATTNGNIGLLKFSNWPFDSTMTYQPIVLKAKRPSFLPIKLSVIEASFWGDFLWALFVPYTIFHARYLPAMHKEETASAEDFAKSVNKKMAESLGLHSCQFDVNDKNEFIKRIKRENKETTCPPVRRTVLQQQRPVRQSPMGKVNDVMVQQVKDVLPQVPIDVIRRDIVKSKSVDVTLANILEGQVSYTALTSEEIEMEKRKQIEKKAETGKQLVKDSRSLSNRTNTLSYQDRKKLMIDEARRRYLEKHPEYWE